NNLVKKKKKVRASVNSEDEENVSSHFLPLSKTTARRKPVKTTARSVGARKRKHLSLSVSSDEENIVPPTQNLKACNKKGARRKKPKVYSDNTPDHPPDENRCPLVPHQRSWSKSGSIPREKNLSSKVKTEKGLQYNSVQKDTHICPPSAGRFVTRRRCAITSQLLILNSSDEFAPLRRTSQNNCSSKRRFPPVFLESSADNSVNAAVLRSFATIPLPEISLNESVEQTLGTCSRKPIFCSTPSAAPFNKKSKLKGFNPISSPSVSCIGPVSISSPEQLTSPQHASQFEKEAILNEFQKPSQLPHEEMSQSVIITHSKSIHNNTSLNRSAQSQCGEGNPGSPSLPSMITIDDDVSSRFTSASGEMDWLTDFLKEKCLTQLCTVRLERIEDLIKLFSETTYSSCLVDLGSVCSSIGKEHSLSVATSHNSNHVKDSELLRSPKLALTHDALSSHESSKSFSVPNVVFVSDSQSTEASLSDGCAQSEHKSTIALFSESTNSSTEVADMQDQDMTELSSILKNKCLSRECSVELKKLPRSSIDQHLTPEPKLGETTSSSTVCESQPNETQTEAAERTRELKKNCTDGKCIVKMKKISYKYQIREKLQENMVSDRSFSESVNEETESEGNCTTASPKETSIAMRRKRTLTSSNEISDKDGSKKSSNKQSNKRKKLSLARKEKDHRTSTHRPGTTRKACVSGLSVSRWKSKDAFTNIIGPRGGTKTVDCSINELIPSQHRQPMKQTDVNKDFSTPVKGHNQNLSSLLAELTPSTHTWSRLKAALSIHRKVILTPKTPGTRPSSRMAMADLSQDLFATPYRTPLSKRLRSQLITQESQLVFDHDEMSDAEKVYAECGQEGPVAWDECLLPQRMKQCVKIGEGTFGEVFSTTSGKSNGEIVALKVIPVEGSEKVNGEDQKTFGEILHEIIISKELSCLDKKEKNQTSGFIGLRDLHCVKGCYPPEFLHAWDKFDKQKHSENDRPDFFENEQLFIILEFEFGGTDLENSNGTLSSIAVAKSILHQVTAALAVAEQELQFEHRDLHWGNVLVKVTKQKTAEFILNGTVHSLDTKGVLVRIIDYSLSRLEIDELTVSCDISNDEELFIGQGDYQFEIYRLMRQENGNEWSSYNPHSNVLWLHYLCSKLLDMKYRGSGGKRNKDIRCELASFYDNVLQFSSATEVLQNSLLFQ
ncbi:hypothetical protein NQD34_000199, partial [Periophthalmus magnuspinnatus]